MELPAGWLTDLAVLRRSGAQILDRGDHLIVRSPDNPGYHWGNFVFVIDTAARDEARRWRSTFEQCFPQAHHLGIGLPARPDSQSWAAVGLAVESDDVLSTLDRPELRPAPPGVSIEMISGSARWLASAQAEILESARTGEFTGAEHRRFVLRRSDTRQRLAETGDAAFFGAFVAGQCVAQLGIVLCGPDAHGRHVARYQDVLTHHEYRGRGLAGHLLAVAAGWAHEAGARRWVIVTEQDSAAGRLYRNLGFAADTRSWRAVRAG